MDVLPDGDWPVAIRQELSEAIYRWSLEVLDYFAAGRWVFNERGWSPVSELIPPTTTIQRGGWTLIFRVPQIDAGRHGLHQTCERVLDSLETTMANLNDPDWLPAFRALRLARRAA